MIYFVTFIQVKDFVRVLRQLRLCIVRLVHGYDEHRESDLEEHEDGEKLAGVDDQAADDDGPRAEEVVKGEKVEDLR